MKRILILYYSQSGDVRRVAEALAAPLADAGAELVWEELRPQVAYPFPWKSLSNFFNQMPECILQRPPEIAEPEFDLDRHYDLVILAYQVWFLSPSLPVQGFFRTRHAAVLNAAKVLTLSVSRNMWQNASQTMKTLLAKTGAKHIDNIVVTHQGPPAATFVTTTRKLFSGREDRAGGVLPQAGVASQDLDRMKSLGEHLAHRLDRLDQPDCGSLLAGQNAVWVNRRYVVPEIAAWYVFRFWAGVISACGRVSDMLRHVGVFLFGCCLLCMILTLPLFLLGKLLITPFIHRRVQEYIVRLYEPTGRPRETVSPSPLVSAVPAPHSNLHVPST
jgi:hypothetical protein